MSYCVNCGVQLPDGTRYCTNCGAQQGAASPYYQPPVPQYSTGGLVAWGIITLLLCTIPRRRCASQGRQYQQCQDC